MVARTKLTNRHALNTALLRPGIPALQGSPPVIEIQGVPLAASEVYVLECTYTVRAAYHPPFSRPILLQYLLPQSGREFLRNGNTALRGRMQGAGVPSRSVDVIDA